MVRQEPLVEMSGGGNVTEKYNLQNKANMLKVFYKTNKRLHFFSVRFNLLLILSIVLNNINCMWASWCSELLFFEHAFYPFSKLYNNQKPKIFCKPNFFSCILEFWYFIRLLKPKRKSMMVSWKKKLKENLIFRHNSTEYTQKLKSRMGNSK